MLLPFLGGALVKLYDDLVVDNRIITDEYTVTTLRSLVVAIVTICVTSNFWICIWFLLVMLAGSILDPDAFKSPHERSLIAVAPVYLAASWSNQTPMHVLDWIFFGAVLVGTAIEAPMFQDDVSVAKLLVRGVSSIIVTALLIVFPSEFSTIRLTLACLLGYALTSSIIQMLFLTGLLRASPPAPEKTDPSSTASQSSPETHQLPPVRD